MSASWYTIQILPNLEDSAIFNLRRQGFEPCFPKRVEYVAGKRVVLPAFKGYGFVRFDIEEDQWLAINSTTGVISLLPRHSLFPFAWPEGFVEEMIEFKRYQTKEGIIQLEPEQLLNHVEKFFPGMKVIVTDPSYYPLGVYGQEGTVTNRNAMRSGDIGGKIIEIIFQNTFSHSNAIQIPKTSVQLITEEDESGSHPKTTKRFERKFIR